MKVSVELVKAFSQDKNYGNPAGVVKDADNLTDGQMLKIAQHYGFSESAFVQSQSNAYFRVRFFSVKQEVDFCGHATIATFYALAKSDITETVEDEPVTRSMETNIGVLPVTCYNDGKVMMAQSPPSFSETFEDKASIAKLLGLQPTEISETPIQIVSTGVNKLIVPLANLAIMRKVQPVFDAIIAHGKNHNYSGISVVTTESFTGRADLATRSFNPNVGINEDPATGIAAGAIGCYTNRYILDAPRQLTIEQGFDMGKASTLYVQADKEVLVGGYAAEFGSEGIEV